MASLFPEARAFPKRGSKTNETTGNNRVADIGGTQDRNPPVAKGYVGAAVVDQLGATKSDTSFSQHFREATPVEGNDLAGARGERANPADAPGGNKLHGQNQEVHSHTTNGADADAQGVQPHLAASNLSNRATPATNGGDKAGSGVTGVHGSELSGPRARDFDGVARESSEGGPEISLKEENTRCAKKTRIK